MIKEMKCPGCGQPQPPDSTKCIYCKQPIIISNFTSVADMPMPMLNKYVRSYTETLSEDPQQDAVQFSVGMCYLKLKLYDKALAAFERAFEENFDNSEAYFYAAICVLGGKKAFLNMRAEIDKAEEYINAALSIEPKAIYHYFLAYIRYDYHSRKFLRMSPDYAALLITSKRAGLSPYDVDQLFKVLGVERPTALL
ncbi:MAG: hypothetical protein FWD58_04845 [Firmicutes bacterium]|nr:hypothetical protein [Bacillota bacterium]